MGWFVGVWALVLASAVASAEEPPGRPNIILISLDTTRADALSCYGTPPGVTDDLGVRTPTLDRLAAEGTRFANAYAHAPTTLSSHTSMLTGLDPHGHAVVRNGFPLDPTIRTLPQRLSEQGWETVGVVAAAALDSSMGLDRGFSTYDDDLESRFGPMVQDRAERVVDRTLAAVDARAKDRPLFLFAHFYDPHSPYTAPSGAYDRFLAPGYQGPMREELYQLRPLKQALMQGQASPVDLEAVTRRYLAEVTYVDEQIERLLSELDARSLLDHTVVVVTADHGEVLHEHGAYAWSHGYDVFPESLRVPLIVTARGLVLPQGRVVERQVSLSELAPTLERLAGLDASLGMRRDFVDMLAIGPVLDGEGWPERPVHTLFAEATRAKEDHEAWNNLGLMRMVRAGGHELRAHPDRMPEARMVAGTAKLKPELLELLRVWDAKAPPHRDEEMDEGMRSALEALGYLDP